MNKTINPRCCRGFCFFVQNRVGLMSTSARFISTNYYPVILRAVPEESLHYNNHKNNCFDIFSASKILHSVQDDSALLCAY